SSPNSVRSTPRSPESTGAPASGSASPSGSSRCTAGASASRASSGRGRGSSSRCPYAPREGAHEGPDRPPHLGQRAQSKDRETAAEPNVLSSAGGRRRRGGRRGRAARAARSDPHGRPAPQALGARRHADAARRSPYGEDPARGGHLVRAERRRPAGDRRGRVGVPGPAVQPPRPDGADPPPSAPALTRP